MEVSYNFNSVPIVSLCSGAKTKVVGVNTAAKESTPTLTFVQPGLELIRIDTLETPPDYDCIKRPEKQFPENLIAKHPAIMKGIRKNKEELLKIFLHYKFSSDEVEDVDPSKDLYADDQHIFYLKNKKNGLDKYAFFSDDDCFETYTFNKK